TEGPVVKGLDVIDLQRAVSLTQIPYNSGSVLEMVQHKTATIMVDNSPCFFNPDAACGGNIPLVLE
uniref:Uncharacterized protein n=1 Tax=Labrus bergylta TaxID=56723 RepID=A0A3Q3F327_9LABR